jgi:Xaa-Pro aminopeptidase
MKIHDEKSKKVVKTKELLFVQKKDPLRETWVGRRLGYSNVKKELGIETGIVNSKLGDVLNDLISGDKYNKIYISLFDLNFLTGEMKEQLKGFESSWITLSTNVQILDLNFILAKMRSVKNEFEIEQ